MAEVLFRVRAVLADRLWALGWISFAVAHVAVLWVPVVRVPGYELSTVQGLLITLLGGAFGLACGRKEAQRVADRPRRQVGLAWLASVLLLGTPALVAVLIACIATLVTSACSPFESIGFWPVLVIPSVIIVAAITTTIGLAVKRWWAQALVWLGVVLLSAAHTTWPILFGPQVSAWNHLAGFLPGPIYDEELHVPAALGWFRVGTLLLAAIALCLACRARGERSWLTKRLPLGLGLALVLLELNGPALGFRMSDAALAARLGGRTEGRNVVLIHPRGLSSKEVARALGDLEFRFAQISDFIGGAPPGPVTVWWYRSAEDKQRLVGAAHTQFAKPWRREIHINDSGFPHPVAKHELAHALLAPLGAAPFGVTARFFGLSPHVGIIEGMAVAADNPVDDLSLHEWTAAMKKQSMLPDVRTLLEPQGFYSAPAARAYTTAGSFLRWLADTRGPEKLRALYRDGDFERVYGVGLPVLASEWEAFLDAVPLEAAAVNQAFARFRRGSLFDRPCAREVARLSTEVARHAADDGPLALELLARCEALQPEEPSHVITRASTLRRLGDDAAARTLLEALAVRVKTAPSSWSEAALALVDLAVTRGDDATARALLNELIALHISPSMDRTAHVRLHSLEASGSVRTAIATYFSSSAESVQVHWLTRAHADAPTDAYVAYLLGRKLHQREAFAEALEQLEVVRASIVPESIVRETLRLMLEAAFSTGRCDLVSSLAEDARRQSQAFGARAHDWVERCERR